MMIGNNLEEISREEWKAIALSSFGEGYAAKVGDADANRVDGHWYKYRLRGGRHPDWIALTRRALYDLAYGDTGLAHGDPGSDRQALQAFLEDINRPAFGEGITDEQYKYARVLMSLEIMQLPGIDGPHDGGPRTTANPAMEEVCEKAIHKASLDVAGGLVAADTRHKVGVVYDLARFLGGEEEPPDDEGFVRSQEGQYLRCVCEYLDIDPVEVGRMWRHSFRVYRDIADDIVDDDPDDGPRM